MPKPLFAHPAMAPLVPSGPTGPACGDLDGDYPCPVIAPLVVTTGKIADLAVTNAKVESITWSKISDAPTIPVVPNTLPPSGPVPPGGDLTGSYPSPVLAVDAVGTSDIQNGAVTDAKIADVAWSKITGVPAGVSTPLWTTDSVNVRLITPTQQVDLSGPPGGTSLQFGPSSTPVKGRLSNRVADVFNFFFNRWTDAAGSPNADDITKSQWQMRFGVENAARCGYGNLVSIAGVSAGSTVREIEYWEGTGGHCFPIGPLAVGRTIAGAPAKEMLEVVGAVVMGAATNATPVDGTLQYAAGKFQGRVAGAWVDIPGTSVAGIPAGGTTGQSLTKKSNTDYDTQWSTVSGGGSGVPVGGTTGQVLTKQSATDFDTYWTTPSGGGASNGALGTQNYITASATITTAQLDNVITANAADIDVTLPAWNTALGGQTFRFTRTDGQTARTVRILAGAGDNIDGTTSFHLAVNQSVTLMALTTITSARKWVSLATQDMLTGILGTLKYVTPTDGFRTMYLVGTSNVAQLVIANVTSKLRVKQYSTNVSEISVNKTDTDTQDDSSKSSWSLQMDPAAAGYLSILRKPASGAWATALQIDNTAAVATPISPFTVGTTDSRIVLSAASIKGHLDHYPGFPGTLFGHNNYWNGSAWTRDNVTQVAYRFLLWGQNDEVTLTRTSAAGAESLISRYTATEFSIPNIPLTFGSGQAIKGHCFFNPNADIATFSINAYIAGGAWQLDNNTRPTWMAALRSDTDAFEVLRAAVGTQGSGAVSLMKLDNAGKLIVPGSAGNPSLVAGTRTVKARVQPQTTGDASFLTLNATLNAAESAWVQDSAASPSWMVGLDAGGGDSFNVNRMAPAGAVTQVLKLDNAGTLTVPGTTPANPNPLVVGTRTVKGRIVTNVTQDAVHLAANASLTASDGAWARDDTSKPAWMVNLAVAADTFYVERLSATGTYSQPLVLDAAGALSVPAFVSVSASDVTKTIMQHSNAAFGIYVNSTFGPQDATKASWTMSLDTAANFNLQRRAPSGAIGSVAQSLYFDSNGNLTISGTVGQKASGTTWSNPSDERMKRDVADYGIGLAAITQLRPVSFEYNGMFGSVDDGRLCYGFIAQEVEPVMPECVGEREWTPPVGEGEPKPAPVMVKTLDQSNIILALVNAVRELAARVEALEAA